MYQCSATNVVCRLVVNKTVTLGNLEIKKKITSCNDIITLKLFINRILMIYFRYHLTKW